MNLPPAQSVRRQREERTGRGPRQRLWRRLPFVGLFLTASGGVVAGEFAPVGFPVWAVAAALLLTATTLLPRRTLLFAGLFALFAAGMRLTTAESLAVRSADVIMAEGRPMEFRVRTTSEARPGGRDRIVFEAALLEVRGRSLSPSPPVVVRMRGAAPRIGEELLLVASAVRPEAPFNPGEFNMASWLRYRGLFLELRTRTAADVVSTGKVLSGWGEGPRRIREWLRRAITGGIGFAPEVCAVIEGVVLGLTDDIPPEMVESFQKSGTLHLFSVSGLHVGMVASLCWLVLGAVGVGPRTCAILIIGLVWSYAIITGASVAAVRAATMASVLLGGVIVSREARPLNSLSAAGFLLLLIRPSNLFTTGFQLSFAAVFALILGASWFMSLTNRHLRPDPFIPTKLVRWQVRRGFALARAVAGLFAVSLVAGLGTTFPSILHFALASPGGVVVNMIAVPLAFLTLALGLLAASFAVISATVAAWINHTNWLFTSLLINAAVLGGKLPGVSVPGHPASWSPAPLVVRILKLEDSHAAAIHTRRGVWLIGAGSSSDYRRVIRPYLRWAGVARLAGLLLPQGDARHFGGAEACVDEMKPEVIVQSGVRDRSPTRASFNRTLVDKGIASREILSGDRITLAADVELHVLHPPPGKGGRHAEMRAVVMRIQTPTAGLMLAMDFPFSIQKRLLNEAARVDFLVFGEASVDGLLRTDFLKAFSGTHWIVRRLPEWRRPLSTSGVGYPSGSLDLLQTGAVTLEMSATGTMVKTHRTESRLWFPTKPE